MHNACDILKSIKGAEWLLGMVTDLEIRIIYCITLVKVIICRLRLAGTRMTANESYVINFRSAEASASYAENPRVWASLPCSYKSIVARPYKFPSSAKVLHSESINAYKSSSQKNPVNRRIAYANWFDCSNRRNEQDKQRRSNGRQMLNIS
jgi:hypothetical protein